MSVLICGAAGIGRSLAQRLHARGVAVHLLSRDAAKLQALSNSLGGAPFTVADVASDSFEDTVRGIAATGVDRISIGALTKDIKATDFSMRFEELP